MGGLGGHMAHLSEDLDLTFNEIVDVLGKVASAEIKTAETAGISFSSLFRGIPKVSASAISVLPVRLFIPEP